MFQPKRVEKLIVEDTAPTASPGTEPLKLYALKMKDIVLPTGVQNIIEARRKVYLELKTFIEVCSIFLDVKVTVVLILSFFIFVVWQASEIYLIVYHD